MTTVKELIEQLKKQDPDRIVIMSRDAEGNGFSPYGDFSVDEEKDMTDAMTENEPAIVLWPQN